MNKISELCKKCFFDCPQGVPCDDFLDGEEVYDLVYNDENVSDVWYEMSHHKYLNHWIQEPD